MFFVGGWLLVSLVFEWIVFNNELAKIRGMIIDQQALNKAYNIMYVVSGGYVLLSILYIVFGLKVKNYPVPITITALVLFVGLLLVVAAIEPKTLVQGIILKGIVIVGLAKSIQAAIAYEAERKNEGGFDDYADRRRSRRDDRDDDDDDRRDRDARRRDVDRVDDLDDRDDDRRGRTKRSERDDW